MKVKQAAPERPNRIARKQRIFPIKLTLARGMNSIEANLFGTPVVGSD